MLLEHFFFSDVINENSPNITVITAKYHTFRNFFSQYIYTLQINLLYIAYIYYMGYTGTEPSKCSNAFLDVYIFVC